MTCKYGVPYVMVTHHMQGRVVAKRCEFSAVWSRLLSGGALDCHSYCCIFAHRFMAMAVIEFGGLKELADTADNYHANINKLYGNFDEFTLAVDKVVRSIVLSMYAHYIDQWPINSTCVGHQALLMPSMLEFAFIYGCYCHCERQLKCFNPTADDPHLSVDALMKDDDEEIQRMDMLSIFKTGMEIMGDADSTPYAETSSMAQVYDMMYAGARDIGLLPLRSRKMKKEMGEVYRQERMELLRKMLSYKDCQKVDCGITVPTCLRMPTLVLPMSECMQRYHNPHLQGLFANKYPENGFGYVQPRGDLRDCIVRRTSNDFPNWLLRHSGPSLERTPCRSFSECKHRY